MPEDPGGTQDLPASDQVAPAGSLDPGQMIGHFVIRARLGEGGMGVVLAGEDPDLGRRVAIKLVKPDFDVPAYRARLLREAQAMARIEHPNVVRVYEIGSDRGRLFVAMELVDGVTLTTWLRVQRRSWREVVAIFQQVGAGLAVVHHAGFVHRDFKPDNVLVDRDGRARVVDFGLTRFDPDRATTPASPDLAASLTHTGMMMGTPGYMAPEQQFGADVDARADQYSFCVALREALLGGRQPTTQGAIDWGDVPRGIRAVVTRGLAFETQERFATMEHLLAALASGTGSRRGVIAGVVAVSAVAAAVIAIVVATSRDGSAPDSVAARAKATEPSAGSSAVASAGASSTKESISVVNAGSPVANAGSSATKESSPVANAGSSAVAQRSGASSERSGATVAKAGSGSVATGSAAKAGSGSVATGAGSAAKGAGSAAAGTPPTKAGSAVVLLPPPPFAGGSASKVAEVKPERHEMIAGHRSAVRAAIEGLGYGGLTFVGTDLEADLRELRDQLAAATDDFDRGVYLYGIGAAERRRGDCIGANKAWAESRKAMALVTQRPLDSEAANDKRTTAFKFLGRTWVGAGLCELANGQALAAEKTIYQGVRTLFGASDGERAEALFAQGIARWESGDRKEGVDLIVIAARRGDAKLRATVSTYLGAVGIKLE